MIKTVFVLWWWDYIITDTQTVQYTYPYRRELQLCRLTVLIMTYTCTHCTHSPPYFTQHVHTDIHDTCTLHSLPAILHTTSSVFLAFLNNLDILDQCHALDNFPMYTEHRYSKCSLAQKFLIQVHTTITTKCLLHLIIIETKFCNN